MSVIGINNNQTRLSKSIRSTIKSRINKFSDSLTFVLIPNITTVLPSNLINVAQWCIPNNVELADPQFYRPGNIDVLLGAGIYFKIFKTERFQIRKNMPFLQNSEFGWFLCGEYSSDIPSNINHSLPLITSRIDEDANLDNLLLKFWESEFYPIRKYLSTEEQICENLFENSVSRSATGRYIVELPLKDNYKNLGESRFQATNRLHMLERRFKSNPDLKTEYCKFINEYIELGHMRLVDESNIDTNNTCYYLPHHPVIKHSSSTTKLRVVFDASAKTTTNLSLNDVLLVGPTVQEELTSIMMRFRKYKYVFSTDIKQMYRQIRIGSKTNLQRILWRSNSEDSVREYELLTVTYGTSSAPYLATRVLKQLALDESKDFPLASSVALHDFYVDDLLSGSNDLNEAKKLTIDLTNMLERGGFTLHKWCSNAIEIISHVPIELREKINSSQYSSNESIKTLGLLWQPVEDQFSFTVNVEQDLKPITKRFVVSAIAKLFDPLGLLSPIMIAFKTFVQQLWRTQKNGMNCCQQKINRNG